MRETKVTGSMLQAPWRKFGRIAGFAAIAFGVGLVMAGPVQAADDDDDEMTFEEKIIDNLMRGVGGTNMENRGIEYRERSPLVVPPKLDLPPPGTTAAEAKVPNWPKDPDEARRKAAIAQRKKADQGSGAGRPHAVAERTGIKRRPAPSTGGDSRDRPGGNPVMLSPSQLGYDGGVLGFFKGNKTESAEFKGEPTRETLTQPPVGYQTPSSKYMYGTGPRESLNKQCSSVAGDCKD